MRKLLFKIIDNFYKFVIDNPKTVLIISGVLTILSVCFLPYLQITTDRTQMVSSDNLYQKRYNEVSELFGSPLTAVIILSGNDIEKLHNANDLFVKRIKKSRYVRDIVNKVDLNFFENNGLLYLQQKDLRTFENFIKKIDISRLEKINNLSQLVDVANTYLEDLLNGNIILEENGATKDHSFIMGGIEKELKKIADKNPNDLFSNINRVKDKLGPGYLIPKNYGLDDKGYLVNNDGKMPYLVFIMVQPSTESTDERSMRAFTKYLRDEGKKIAETNGVDIGVTGMPAIITDEMHAVNLDVRDIVVSSIVCILLLFLLAFRSLRATILVAIPLVVGLLWTIAFSIIFYDKLTLISAYFAAVLFGIGIAYDIHILSRFDELRHKGVEVKQAALDALRGAGPGVFTGATTTAAAFYAIGSSDFYGFSQLGIISGTGVLFMMLTAFSILPATLIFWRGNKFHQPVGSNYSARLIDSFIKPLAVYIISAAAILFIIGIWGLNKIKFDYDPFALLPQNAESIINYYKLLNRSNFSSELNISTAPSLEKAEQFRIAFSKLKTVSRVDSVSLYIPNQQEQKLEILNKIKAKNGEEIEKIVLHFKEVLKNLSPITNESFSKSLIKISETLEDGWFTASQSGRAEARYLKLLSNDIKKFAENIEKELDNNKLNQFQDTFFNGFSVGLQLLENNLNTKKISTASLPENIKSRFVAQKNGNSTFALYVYPKGHVGNRKFLEKFISECRSIDPQITGFPVTHYENGGIIKKSFVQAAIYSAIIVFLLVLLDFKSFRKTLISLIPLGIGTGWMMAFMYVFKIDYNFVNVIALSMVLGSGVDFGVHLMHRFLQENDIYIAVKQTGGAVILSALTTLVGFSSMVFARHNGAASLGILLTIGIVSCIVSAMIVFPAALIKFKNKF